MFDVIKRYPSVSDELIEKFSKIEESASINESLPCNGALNHDFRPVWPLSRMVGRAFTVSARAGDNLMLHKALTLLKPGDVLVVTCDGFQESGGMWGGIMSNAAMTMGCRGMVIDGCVRDTVMMKNIGFPVWSRGISVKRSTKLTGGKINHPVVIGNVLVNPGDLIFADNDGVICVPYGIADDVYEKTVRREHNEDDFLKRVLVDGTATFYGNPFKDTYASLGLSEEE